MKLFNNKIGLFIALFCAYSMVHGQTVKTSGGSVGTSTQAALEISSGTSLGTTPALVVDVTDDNAVNGYGFFVAGNATPSLGNAAKHTQISTGDADSRMTLKCGEASDFAPRLQMISGNDVGGTSNGAAIFDYGSRNFDASATAFFSMRYMPTAGAPVEMIKATPTTVLLAHQSGMVGVGTSSPEELLHVAGTVRSDDLSGSGIRNVGADADGNLVISAGSGGGGADTDWVQGSGVVYNTTDLIGIGTNSPLSALHVNGGNIMVTDTYPFIELIQTSSATNAGLAVSDGITSKAWVYWHGTDSVLTINTSGDGFRPDLGVDADGNVGIGTNNPIATLDVRGDLATSGAATISETLTVGDSALYVNHFANAVGIGTDAPAASLHIAGGNDLLLEEEYPFMYLNTTSGDNAGIVFQDQGANDAWVWKDRGNNMLRISADGDGTSNHFNIGEVGNVGVGTSASLYRMHIVGNVTNTLHTLHVETNTIGSNSHAIHGEITHTNTSDSRAVYGESTPVDNYGYGGYFVGGYRGAFGNCAGSGSATYTGVYGSSTGTNTGTNRGVYGWGANGATNIGGYFTFSGGTAGTGSSSGSYAVYANGSSYSTGTWYSGSDRRFKENIESIDGALSIIDQLNPTTYDFKQEGKFGELNFPEEKQYGFIAQEVEEVLPEIVRDVDAFFNEQDEDKTNDYQEQYKGMNYTALVPILTQGIKEQQAMISDLEGTVEAQQAEIEALKAQNAKIETLLEGLGLSDETTTVTPNGGSTSDANQLFQNRPNPFNQTTEIPYYLAEEGKAQIMVYDMRSGAVVRTFDVVGLGHGTVTMDSSSLAQGAYSYGLVVNGKQVASKIMILAD